MLTAKDFQHIVGSRCNVGAREVKCLYHVPIDLSRQYLGWEISRKISKTSASNIRLVLTRLHFHSQANNLQFKGGILFTMTLLVLTETSAGLALLKARDKKLLKRGDITEQTSTAHGTAEVFERP
jgi:hypothetical protein